MDTPRATGTPLIDGVIPLFRLLDAAAAAEPVLMWLAWAMTATALAALPTMASRTPSLLVSLLLLVPGSQLLALSFTIFSMLLSDLVRLHPWLNVAIALVVSFAPILAGWSHAGSLPRHMQSAEVTLRLARPGLITIVVLGGSTLLPFTATAVIPPLIGAAVLVTELILTLLTRTALERSSTSRSRADLRGAGCLAPVYVVPDGTMAVPAVAVGLTHASSAVFLQQHVEDAVRGDDPAMAGAATHILAHEAGHVVQHHGLWRTLAASVLAGTLSVVVPATGVRSMVIVAVSLLVLGLVTLALGEWAAERFAKRATNAPAPGRATWEASR